MLAAAVLLSTRMLAFFPALAAGPSALELVAKGDAHYAQRDEGSSGPRADAKRIEQAVAAYRGALSLDPGSLPARSKLLRSLFFRASFCDASDDEQRRLFDEARHIADDGLSRLGKTGPRANGEVDLDYWAAAAWGEWAQRASRLTAAREGAASRVRDLAQRVIDLDPKLEEGGGYRILGRLHDVSPRILFVTGWVSRPAALSNLRKAYSIAPNNTVNRLFLAEAILRHDPTHRPEALDLLRALASATPSADYRVEDASFIEQARRRLLEVR